jgi:hypothetical protein
LGRGQNINRVWGEANKKEADLTAPLSNLYFKTIAFAVGLNNS